MDSIHVGRFLTYPAQKANGFHGMTPMVSLN